MFDVILKSLRHSFSA